MSEPQAKRGGYNSVIITAILAIAGVIISVLFMNSNGGNVAASAAGAFSGNNDSGNSLQVETSDGGTSTATILSQAGGHFKVPSVGTCTFDAYDAAPGSNEFGPEQTDFASANEALESFANKMARDGRFAGIELAIEEQGITAANQGLDPETQTLTFDHDRARQLTEQFCSDPQAWQDAINGFFKRNPKVELVDMHGINYWSFGQIPGASRNDIPDVTLLAQEQSMGQALKFSHEDGKGWAGNFNRVPCNWQQSMPRKPSVPPAPQRSYAPPPQQIVPPAPPRYAPPTGTPCSTCQTTRVPSPPPTFTPPPPCKYPSPCGCNTPCTTTQTPPPPPPPPSIEVKHPEQDPYPRGNAPQGGGHNDTNGPGEYIPPAQMTQPPSTAYTPPPAPAPVWVPETQGGPTYAPAQAPPAATQAPETGTTTTTTTGGQTAEIPGYAGGGSPGSAGAGNGANGANSGDTGGF